MTVVNAWQGGVTSTAARVRAKVSGSSTRLLVADNSGLSGAVAVGPVTPTADGIATLDVSGLNPNTRYHWAVEDDGDLDSEVRGQFRTHPVVGEPASFSFAAATCAGGGVGPEVPGVGDVLASSRLSNHPVFDTLRSRALSQDALFFFHGGDIHYYDLSDEDELHGITGGGSLANYRRAYDDVLLQPRQHRLYREVPLVLSCGGGGHDWGQPIGLARNLPGRDNCLTAWRERAPDAHQAANPNPAAGTYRSFQIGRVLFFVSDENADRDPDADPEGPNKSKLGAAQLAYLESTLTNTGSEVLVWLSGAQWHRGGSGNWGRYTSERSTVQQMLGDLGWLDRMVFVTGDRHALEIVRAQDNPHGGFPLWHYASLDSPTASSDPPGSPGNNRYGTVRVVDTGSRITLTGTGWIGDTVWDSDVLSVSARPPTPPPTPTPTPVARARIRRTVTWLGVHAVTGRVIAELPDVRGEVGRLLSAYDSTQLTIPIPLGGPGHVPIRLIEQATQPVNSAIVAVVNDLPVWMGWVLSRRGGTGAELRLACVTPEGYLARRRVRDHTLAGVDRALVAAELAGDANGLNGIGEGFGFEIDAQLTGDIIDRTYLASDRATVYDQLRELAVTNLEFTVDLDWASNDRNVVRKILRLYPRIGKADGALFETTASSMFESRAGSEAVYELMEDAATGRMANHVVAIGPGEGEDQPASDPAVDQAALDGGAPIVEHVLDLSSPSADPASLDAAARAELARLRRGAEVWQIDARLDAYPRLGIDAQLGDTVSWLLTGHRHPTGVMGTGRMVGYRVDQQAGRWRPILLDPQEA